LEKFVCGENAFTANDFISHNRKINKIEAAEKLFCCVVEIFIQ
jgi:hypothetical protein